MKLDLLEVTDYTLKILDDRIHHLPCLLIATYSVTYPQIAIDFFVKRHSVMVDQTGPSQRHIQTKQASKE